MSDTADAPLSLYTDARCDKLSVVSDTPDAPRSIEVVDASRAGITVQWDVPRHDGGAPVTGYVLERAHAYTNRSATFSFISFSFIYLLK